MKQLRNASDCQSAIMELLTQDSDGEFDVCDLLGEFLVDTPLFISDGRIHLMFKLDERIVSENRPVRLFGSAMFVFRCAVPRIFEEVPPAPDGSVGYWILKLEDCPGGLQQLPDHVVERVLAADYQSYGPQTAVSTLTV